MGLFGPGKNTGNGNSADKTSAGMRKAAKAAKRGGSGIRQAVKAKPRQV